MAKDRLLFVQYGDFREAVANFEAGGAETYQAQRQSVDQVNAMAAEHAAVMVVVMVTEQRYDETLSSGVRVIGLGPQGALDARGWSRLLDELSPDRIILRTPLPPVLRWVSRRKRPTLVTLADSFHGSGLRETYRRWRLKRLLNDPMIGFVANHGRRASLQLFAMGVSPKKIIPWDWPAARRPHDQAAKAFPGDGISTILFVGMLSTSKGADDLIDAVARLRAHGKILRAILVGKGDAGRLRERAVAAGVGDQIDLPGLIPNAEVQARMRAADLVVVPSRHDYPEGLPLTIYEAFCSRTPLIVSDHPMFVGNVVDSQDGLMFTAADPAALAESIAILCDNQPLYEKLSQNSEAAWERLQLPVSWGELVDRWLGGRPEDLRWLQSHTLAEYDYQAGVNGKIASHVASGGAPSVQ